MEKTERQFGVIVTDFVNAETTDQACFKHFENMAELMAFHPSFAERVKELFPSLSPFNSLNQPDKKLLELICREDSIKNDLGHRISRINCELHGYDCQSNTLFLVNFRYEGGDFVEGEPDVNVIYERPFPMHLDEFKNEVECEIGGALESDTFDRIDDLMEIGQNILKLKTSLSETRFQELKTLSKQYEHVVNLHENIEAIRNRYREILEMIIQGKDLHEIQYFPKLVNGYNLLLKSKLVLADANLLIQVPPINEASYLKTTQPITWSRHFARDLNYCLIEFLIPERSKDYIGKCPNCKKYFIAKKLNNKKYCDPKCRLAYHNRKRIESGEAREYKRKKYRDGHYKY